MALGYYPDALLAALPKFGYGLLGVFLVMGIIMLTLYLLSALCKPKKKK